MPSSRTRRFLHLAARIALAGALALVAIVLVLVLFTGPLVDYVLGITSESFNGEVRVQDASLGLDGVHFQNLQLTDADGHPILTAPRGVLRVHPLRMLARGHWIGALGDLSLEEPGFQVEISPEGRLNLSRLIPSPRPGSRPLLPEFTGTVRVQDGWIGFQDLRREGFLYQLRDWDGSLTFRRGEEAVVDFRFVPVQDQPGQIRLQGTLHPTAPKLDLEILAGDIVAKRLTEHPFIRNRVTVHSGTVNARVWGSLDVDRWEEAAERFRYGGNISLSKGEVRVPGLAVPIRQIEARLELLTGFLQVKEARGNILGTGFNVHGRIFFPPNGRVDLLATVPRMRSDTLAGILNRPLPLTGQARVDVAITGPFDDLQIAGEMNADKLTVQGQELREAEVRFRVDGTLVHLESVRALAGGGVVEGGGYLLLGKDTQLALRISGADLPLGAFSPVGGRTGEFQLTVLGSASQPVVLGSSTRVAGFQGLGGLVDWVSGSFLYFDGGVVVLDGAAGVRGGEVQIPYAMYDARDPFFSAIVSTARFDLPSRRLGTMGDLSGQIRGRFQVSGPPNSLRDIDAFGVSEGTDLQLGNLSVTDLRGRVGMSELQLLLPGLTGRTAGGSLVAAGALSLAGGPTDMVVSAEGVDLSQVASILNRPLHVLLPGSGDALFAWQSAGRGEPSWFTVAAESPGGEGYGPWSAAGYGFAGPAGLGAMAWVDGVPLEPRPLTRTLDLNGTVTGEIAAWGRVEDIHFAYNAGLRGSEVTGVRGDLILGVGEGRIQGPWVHLGDNLLTWQYEGRDDRPAALSGLEGAAIPWYGPILATRLEEGPVADPPLPPGGAVAVTGSFRMGLPADYNIRYDATGIDLAWLGRQRWVPEAGDVMRALNVTAGVAESEGTVFADAGLPRLARNSWVQAPWLVVGREGSPRGPQVYSAVGNVWMGPNTGRRPGAIHLDPLVMSRTPYAPALPTVAELDRADRRALAREGLMVLQGWVRAPEVSLTASGQGWDVSDVLAFAPAAAEFPSDILTGTLQVDRLQVKGRLSDDFLSSLDVTGNLAIVNGFVNVAGFPVPVQRLAVTVSQRQRQLLLTDFSLDSGPLHMEGTGSRSASGRWQADLWAHDFPMSYLHYLGPPYTRLTGAARMALFLDSGGLQPSVYVGFEGRGVGWRSEPTPVEFPRLSFGRLREAEDGSLRTGPTLGVRLSTAPLGLALEAPQGAVDVEARLAGSSESSGLTATGLVEFTPDFESGPRAWFAGPGGPDFGVAAAPFRMEVRDLQGSLLRALAGLAPDERRFTFSGTLSLLGQWWRDHAIAAGGGRPDFRMAVSRLEIGQGGGDTWTGLALTDPFEARYVREPQYGRLLVDPFTFAPRGGAGTLGGQAELVLTRAPDAVDVPGNRLEVRGQDLDPSSLDFLVPGAGRLGRIEEFTILATGPLMTPDLQMAVRMADGRIGPLQVASLNAGLQGGRTGEEGGYEVRVVGPDGGPARLSFGGQETPDQVVEISGSLPLLIRRTRAVASEGRLVPVWAGYDVESGGEMHLLANMTDNQLRLLDELVPGVSQTSGTLQGRLELSGTLARPELAGSFNVENGAFTHEMAGRFTGLNVKTRFEEIPAEEAQPTLGYVPTGEVVSRLSIEQFDGLLGGQPFKVAGSAELSGVEPINVAVNLRGERLPLQWGDLFEGVANVSLDLLARPGRIEGEPGTTLIPIVTGAVNVLQGDITVPLSGLGGEGGEQATGLPKLPIDYRVNLTLGDDVWVHLLGSRIRAQGDLRLFADPETQEPVLSGAVDLSRGVLSLPFYDVSFRVRQGRAVFQSSRIPTLENVEAETELAGYSITAFVNGTYPDLRFEFVSNPPLAQTEIQRLLAVGGLGPLVPGSQPGIAGQPGTDLNVGSFVAGQSLSLVSQLLTAPISREIGRLLFLSDFSFDFIPPYNFVVKVAKALDDKDRFLLTLTRVVRGGAGTGSSTGLDETLYGLEWRFQRNLLMRVAFDQFGQLRTWFQGLWEF